MFLFDARRWIWKGGNTARSTADEHSPDLLILQSLPRVETLGSRQFLMHLFPELCTVPSAVRPLRPKPKVRRTRALDVGAGIGRVTADTLLHLFDDVVILEPVDSLVREAYARGTASNPSFSAIHAPRIQQGDSGEPPFVPWKGIADSSKSVTFFQGGLQTFDPANPTKSTDVIGRIGFVPEAPMSDLDSGFDVVWCQWCLMYLSDTDLVAFLKRSKPALRDPERSVIVVKENLCSDGEYNTPITIFDQEDSSVTRYVYALCKISWHCFKPCLQIGFGVQENIRGCRFDRCA